MGRGLSNLQRYILREASTRKRLYYSEVFVGYYGWTPSRSKNLACPGKHFSPTEMGEKKYRAVMSALNKACLRLEKRGLVVCLTGASARWAAVEITDEGRLMLSADIRDNLPTCQPIEKSKDQNQPAA